ncbi:hypothetical protein HYX03_01465 [Candidatus Woesearchaeota archaeon]|nr:hypothetical protein [Candidatus Woesearchaeota archaeon]
MSRLVTYTVFAILIGLIVAFLIFNSEAAIKKLYTKAGEKETCKASVQSHARLKMRYADFSGEIKCPTVKLKIEDKNEESAKNKIADAMYDCWDQFGRGKLDLFSDDSVYCSICHRITFDKNVKINGFTNYLATKTNPGQKISYLQFLTTEQTQNSDFLKELENRKIEDTIDASKKDEYAIVFTYIKGKKYLEEYTEKAKYTAPGIGIIALGFGIFKAGGIIGGAVSSIATPFLGVPVGLTISSTGGFVMAVGALWTYVAPFMSGIPFEHISLISLIPYDAQNLQTLNCEKIPIKQ